MDRQEVYVHPTAVVDEGAAVGDKTKIWHFCHIMTGAVIGTACSLGQNVYVGSKGCIGSGVKIQNNVSIYDNVFIGDDVFLGPSCVFTNVINPRAFVERKDEYRRTVVEQGATIGANATVVCGVTIGSYALVGAGAVVTKNVPAHALVYGNPARRHGWVSRTGVTLNDDLVCPESGEEYELHRNGLMLKGQQPLNTTH